MADLDLNPMLGLPAGTLPNDAVIKLSRKYRGKRLYVPRRPFDEHHPVVKAIGLDNARRLQEALPPGATKEIGRLCSYHASQTHRMVRDYLAEGHSVSDVAHKFSLSRRWVQRIKNAAGTR